MKKLLLLISLFCFTASVYADEPTTPKRIDVNVTCPKFFVNDKSPVMPEEITGFCIKTFSISLYTKSGAPAWVAEHITTESLITEKRKREAKVFNVNLIPASAWERIERITKQTVFDIGEAYVVNGLIYENPDSFKPSYIYKAVYYPQSNTASAYFINMTDENSYTVISIKELSILTKSDVFPGLDAEIKTKKIALPDAH